MPRRTKHMKPGWQDNQIEFPGKFRDETFFAEVHSKRLPGIRDVVQSGVTGCQVKADTGDLSRLARQVIGMSYP